MLVCTSAPVLQCSCTLVLLWGRAPVGGALCGGSAAVLLCGSDAAWRCCCVAVLMCGSAAVWQCCCLAVLLCCSSAVRQFCCVTVFLCGGAIVWRFSCVAPLWKFSFVVGIQFAMLSFRCFCLFVFLCESFLVWQWSCVAMHQCTCVAMNLCGNAPVWQCTCVAMALCGSSCAVTLCCYSAAVLLCRRAHVWVMLLCLFCCWRIIIYKSGVGYFSNEYIFLFVLKFNKTSWLSNLHVKVGNTIRI
jgi:hypothetical protein